MSVVLLGLVMLDLALAATVGQAAANKGRSYRAWFWISLFSGCLVPALVVARMGPSPREQRGTHRHYFHFRARRP
jgi:hypothetical protein